MKKKQDCVSKSKRYNYKRAPVSGTQELPLPELHAHTGAGHVDELHEGDQGAPKGRHAKGLESGALTENRTKLLIRGVGRKIGNVESERRWVSGARNAGRGCKRGRSVRLGPIIAGTVCGTSVRSVCLPLVPETQVVSRCRHAALELVRAHVVLLRNNKLRGLAHWSLGRRNAGSNIFVVLAITTKLGVFLGKFDANLFGIVWVEGKTVHLLHGSLRRGNTDEKNKANRHTVFVVPSARVMIKNRGINSIKKKPQRIINVSELRTSESCRSPRNG